MAEILGSSPGVDILLCGEGNASVKGSICLYMDLDIHEHIYIKGVGRVGSTHRGTGSTQLSLDITGNAKGFTKRVVRGEGLSLFTMDISIRGAGLVRSVVVGRGNREIPLVGSSSSIHNVSSSKVLTPIYTTKQLNILLANSGSFIPEIGIPVLNDRSKINFDNQRKIDIEVIKEYISSDTYTNDRRNWLVARVSYEKCPVMYLLNTGWQGITFPTRYLLDGNRYQYMIFYLWNLMQGDKGSTDPYSLSGMMSDRIRTVQTPITRLNDLPKALREIIVQLGDNLE